VQLWAAAGRLAEAKAPAALATVARQRGSLPMASDAKMLVTKEGDRLGTVGGGCVEADVIEQALATIETGKPTFVRHTLNADLAGDLGLSCGGTVELFLEPVTPSPEMARLCVAVSDGINSRTPVTVMTSLDWSKGPAKSASIGTDVLTVGRGVEMPDGQMTDYTRTHGATFVDEARAVLVERVQRLPRLIIFGAGHVGVAIAKVAASAGFYVVVSDDREDFANENNVPDADEILVGDFNAVLDRLHIDEDDHVLATTRGHNYDANIVERTASSRARYVGMLGSRRKKEIIWKALRQAGVSAEDLGRVRTPIGLDIGADTPGEIAVSVVAELIRCWRLPESAEQDRD
jgi:xanthine dehydrogenase accessory factor